MNKLLKRVQVVIKALPTWLAGAAVVVAAVSGEVAKAFPQEAVGVVHVCVVILAGLGAAIGIVRKVTPVIDSQVGLLPPEEK